MKRIGVCVVVLLVGGVFTVSARAQIPPECQNLPPSAGPVPQPCADALLLQPMQTTGLETNIAPLETDLAFGPEFTTGNLVSLVLNAPQVLNAIGPTVGPNGQDIGACDFDNTGTFTHLFALERLTAATLFTLDTATGAVTPIGPTVAFGVEQFFGLAADPTDGTLYASSSDIIASSSLYMINPATGTATRIGPLTNSPGNIAIAFDLTGQLFGYDVVNDSLIAINKATGAGTIIGPLGFDANFAQGMDFDETDGTCYLFAFNADTSQSELRTCNTATGATTLVRMLGATTPGGLVNLGCAGIAIGGIVSVPTLPQWSMILLTLCLLTAATWQLAGQRVLFGVGTAGGTVFLPDRGHWLSSLLLGQGVAAFALFLYGVLVGPLVAHDGVGAVLSGLLIGVMIGCYRRERSV